MPIAIYVCDTCKKPLDLVASEGYPANMVYATPNATSYYYKCEQCGNLLYGEELPGKPIEWQELDKQTWEGRMKGLEERKERIALREEKEKLLAERPEVVRRIEEAEGKASELDRVLENLRIKVQALSDKYDEQAEKRNQLQQELDFNRPRLAEIDERLKELIHIK